MSLSQLTCSATIAIALMVSAGCESMNFPPLGRDRSPRRPGLGIESDDNSTIDAYDQIVYERIERNWRAMLDTLGSMNRNYSPGRVKVTFRLYQTGRITNLKMVERTVNYREAKICWKAVKKLSDLPAWPPELRRLVHRDYRDLVFNFYYDNHQTHLVFRDKLFSVRAPYDREMMTAIQKKWYSYLDTMQIPYKKQGEVAVEFTLHRDGTITDARVIKSSVTAPFAGFCRQAVLESAPFPNWPQDMRNHIEKDYRKLLITFYYEK